MEDAAAAHEWYEREGITEADWRALAALARAQAGLKQLPKSRIAAAQASGLLTALGQKWDADAYRGYLARPDIQYNRGLLARIAGAK